MKIYGVIQIEENGKYYAHAWGFLPSDNVVALLERFGHVIAFSLCNTKKEACRLVESYRNDFKRAGVYMFDDAPLF